MSVPFPNNPREYDIWIYKNPTDYIFFMTTRNPANLRRLLDTYYKIPITASDTEIGETVWLAINECIRRPFIEGIARFEPWKEADNCKGWRSFIKNRLAIEVTFTEQEELFFTPAAKIRNYYFTYAKRSKEKRVTLPKNASLEEIGQAVRNVFCHAVSGRTIDDLPE
jgi:hypothetical protein